MNFVYKNLFELHGFSPAQKIIIDLVRYGEVLEVGSSAGYMTKEFVKNGCIVDIIEKDQATLKLASDFAREVFAGSIEDEDLQGKIKRKYTKIVCADILEHLVNPAKVLIFLKTRLKKEGQILISIPNVAFWNMRLELLKGSFEYQDSGVLDKTHLRFYTYNSFLKLLREAGLKVVKVYPAEGKIPFEYTLRKLPLLGNLIANLIKSHVMKAFPNLTYYHYVVQAKI